MLPTEGREWTHNLDGNETFYLTKQSNDDMEWKKVVERSEDAQHNLRQVLSAISERELEQNSLEGNYWISCFMMLIIQDKLFN